MTELNVPLIETTMTYILDNPEKHDQASWTNICGTTQCFAGHALVLSGKYRISMESGVAKFVRADSGVSIYDEAFPGIMDNAARVLGLTEEEASVLFLNGEDQFGVQSIVKDILDGRYR